jgi:hypothetical protein
VEEGSPEIWTTSAFFQKTAQCKQSSKYGKIAQSGHPAYERFLFFLSPQFQFQSANLFIASCRKFEKAKVKFIAETLNKIKPSSLMFHLKSDKIILRGESFWERLREQTWSKKADKSSLK